MERVRTHQLLHFIWLFTEITVLSADHAFNYEQQIRQQLLMKYDNHALPVANVSDSVKVSYGVEITKLDKLDGHNDMMTITIIENMNWVDPRLTWNPASNGNIKSIRIPIDDVWRPDFEVFNQAPGSSTVIGHRVIVINTGTVIYIPYKTLTTYCSFDFTKFPYDEQTCSVVLGSWTYSKDQIDIGHAGRNFEESGGEVDIQIPPDGGSDDGRYEHSQWKIMSAKGSIQTKKYACCTEEYQTYIMKVKFQRKANYYRYAFVIPAAVFTMLVPLVFALPADSPQKINLGILIMVSEVLLMILFEDSEIFDHSTVPRLAIFHQVVFTMSAVNIGFCTFVFSLCVGRTYSRPVPAWIKNIFLENQRFRLLLLMGQYSRHFSESKGMLLEEVPSETSPQNEELHFINNEQSGSFGQLSESARYLADRACAKAKRENIRSDWLELARVFDRVFFLVFVIVVIVTLSIYL